MKTAGSRLVLIGLLGVSMRLAGRQEATGNDISVVLDLPSPVGVGFGRVKQQRVMDSEVALVRLSDGIWFMARRVLTVAAGVR